MRLSPFIVLLFLLLPFNLVLGQDSTVTSRYAATALADSTNRLAINDPTPTDDFAPGLFLVVVACLLISIGVAFAGAVLGIGIMVVLFLLFSIGVLSVSVASGLYKRSFMAGFKVFVMSAMAILGAIGGSAILMLANYLFNLHFAGRSLLLIGILGGLAGGLLLGVLLNLIIRNAMKWIQGRFELR